MNWGEFEYFFNRDNTIDALPKFENAKEIVELKADGYLRVDERLPILSVDEISKLTINKKQASGPVKLQYYARLFDSDAPGFSETNDKAECFENAESLANYPTSYYRSTVSVDNVIDVFVKGLNADYDHDTNGPMKNKTAIHGLGQFRNSVRALQLLNLVAAKSEHSELRDLAKAEIQEFDFDDVASVKKVIAIFDQSKKDSALAIQTLDSLAWVYHNTNNSEVKAQIVALKDAYKLNIDSNPPKYPALVDGKTDWLDWSQAVNHFKKKIDHDNPEVSRYRY